jgi:hypothetical protein
MQNTIKLIPKPTAKDAATGEIEAILRELLERAKAGEFSSLLFVVENQDGQTEAGWNHSFDFRSRMGALEVLKLDWYASLWESH